MEDWIWITSIHYIANTPIYQWYLFRMPSARLCPGSIGRQQSIMGFRSIYTNPLITHGTILLSLAEVHGKNAQIGRLKLHALLRNPSRSQLKSIHQIKSITTMTSY